MGAEVEFKQGMFHLFDLHTEEAAKAMLDRAEEYLDEYGGYPSTALKNAAGVAQCVLGKKEKALELFRQVLENDPENINALENSRIVYRQLGQKEDAEDCAIKVQSLLDDSQPERDLAFQKARCFAEQGLAIKCNVAVELLEALGGEDLDHARKALAYFEKAFQVDDGQLFTPEERLQWEAFMGRSYLDLYNHYFRMGSGTEDQLDIYNKAVHALARVARVSNQQNHKYRAKAWTHLGTLLWKRPLVDSTDKPSSVTDCDLTREWNKPDLCFQTALWISANEPKILTKYSRYLLKNKDHKKAKHFLDQSIEIDSSTRNWLAFSSRAKAYKGLYRKEQDAFRSACNLRQRGTPPNKYLLMRAKRDSEYSIKIRANLNERISLGETLVMLRQSEKAMKEFKYVVNHLEGRKNPDVHIKMAHCLLGIAKRAESDPRKAIESFKRAVEVERGNLLKLFASLNALQLLMDECLKHPSREYLLDEFCYWLAMVDEKHKDEPVSELIRNLCDKYRGSPMVVACRKLVDQKRYSLASKCLSKLRAMNAEDEREIQRLEERLNTCSWDMSLLNLSGAGHHSVSPNIRPALASSTIEENTFDCFILHCPEKADADWVHYSLLPRLEEGYGYKCCAPARDIDPHSSRDFESCVGDAGCVIVVLTPSFCCDPVCKDQLAQIVPTDTVGDDSKKIIAIVREVCDLLDTLRGMKTIQYYSWELLLRDVKEACNLHSPPHPPELQDTEEALGPPSSDSEDGEEVQNWWEIDED